MHNIYAYYFAFAEPICAVAHKPEKNAGAGRHLGARFDERGAKFNTIA